MGNQLFPVFLKLEALNVLLVGAGFAGTEKANAILSNSPSTRLKIVSETISNEILNLKKDFPHIKIEKRLFKEEDLAGVQVLFLAINNKTLSAEIQQKANEKNIIVNVADTPDLCDFYLGSVVQKGNLKIGISTNGKSPTIAKRLKEFFNENLPEELDELLTSMNALRNKLRGDFSEKVKQLNELTSVLGNSKIH